MTIREYMKDHVVYLDGGMGSLLQAEGLGAGEHPERWNLTHAEVIRKVHKAYFDAGCNVVNTNTFGANTLKFSEAELEEIICAAVDNARWAAANSCGEQPKFVALDIGPLGRLLKPYGDLDFEDAVTIFAKIVCLGVKYGADLIFIETMNDSYLTKAALLAAKENSDLPVFVSNAYSADGKLMTGASPAAMAAMLEGMGADAIGANCSLGPKQLRGVMEELLRCASVPVILKPNAGLPRSVDGKTVYDVLPEEFAAEVADMLAKGVRLAGGCCGTTPAYIAALTEKTKGATPVALEKNNETVISSYTHTVAFGEKCVLIGNRIDPAVTPDLEDALREGEMDDLVEEGLCQQDAGAQVLAVKVSLPELDEAQVLRAAVEELQTIIRLPLLIDTADAAALECALRRYNGKAMISVKAECVADIFPLVKKYGAVAVVEMADAMDCAAVLAKAAACGIDKKDILFAVPAAEQIEKAADCGAVLRVSDTEALRAALERGAAAVVLDTDCDELVELYDERCE